MVLQIQPHPGPLRPRRFSAEQCRRLVRLREKIALLGLMGNCTAAKAAPARNAHSPT